MVKISGPSVVTHLHFLNHFQPTLPCTNMPPDLQHYHHSRGLHDPHVYPRLAFLFLFPQVTSWASHVLLLLMLSAWPTAESCFCSSCGPVLLEFAGHARYIPDEDALAVLKAAEGREGSARWSVRSIFLNAFMATTCNLGSFYHALMEVVKVFTSIFHVFCDSLDYILKSILYH